MHRRAKLISTSSYFVVSLKFSNIPGSSDTVTFVHIIMSHEQVENHPLHRARTCMSELGAPRSQQEEGRTERTRNFREILLGYAKFKITCAKQMCMNKSIEQLYDDEDRFVPNVVASAK